MSLEVPPDVSLIVIAYNEEQRIGDCLTAVLDQQTARRFEVIVVDDGSSDETAARVRSMAAQDERVRLVVLPWNRGRGAARSAGVATARGGVIGFVDADILVPSDWVETLADELQDAEGVSGIAVPDGDCAVVWRITGAIPRRRRGSAEITGNNVLFEASLLRATGFDEKSRLGEDFRLARRLVGAGHRLKTVPSVVVEHREAKNYGHALRYLYDSGVDATALLLEFRQVRGPDLAWLGWSAAVLTALAGVGLGVLPGRALGATVVGGVVGVAAAHAATRFEVTSAPARFAYAFVADVPMIAAYLVGRTVGAVRLPFEGLPSPSPHR